MLQEVLEYIHNFFIHDRIKGEFQITDGSISLPSVLEGQRIWIVDSVFNDGVYTYYEAGIKTDDDTDVAGLVDETFAGTICALAVPPAVIALSQEISEWVEKYGEAAESPYQSENVIGVYSYTKKTGGDGASSDSPDSWQGIFGKRLARWRKVNSF